MRAEKIVKVDSSRRILARAASPKAHANIKAQSHTNPSRQTPPAKKPQVC
ncbi:hypothetical protein [Helicobacter canis]|nr:hypothetical protein [Helicobacter canis]